jgi:hypothetical protein
MSPSQPDARELALSVKASASSLEAAGQGALADISCRLADAVLDLAGDDHARLEAESPLPRTFSRPYDLRQRLNRAVRYLRDAEDIARLEMPAWPTADRIRSIYEQITADVLEGSTWMPPIRERLDTAETELAALREAARAVASFHGVVSDRDYFANRPIRGEAMQALRGLRAALNPGAEG